MHLSSWPAPHNVRLNLFLLFSFQKSPQVSDFLCWFPIGLAGLLAANGARIPGEVNVAMAILVMPINSTINPFLYTLNIVLETRRRAREQRLQDWVNKKVKAMVAEADRKTVVPRGGGEL